MKYMTDKTSIVIHRYMLPSVDGQGWAIIMLSSDGVFSAVSDFGNYAHWWSAHRRSDVREIFVPESGWDYIVSKLGQMTYDGPATVEAIKRSIIDARRDGKLDRDEARAERQWLSEQRDDLERSEVAFWIWAAKSEIKAEGLIKESYSRELRAFAKHVLPRLAEVLQQELAAESAAAGKAPVVASP